MKSIRNIVISLIVLLALVVGGALLLFGLPFTGWKAMNVQTGSMSPNIPTGSMVFVHRVPASSLKVGDVITYTSMQKRKEPITHRITQAYMADGRIPGFVTKGDANTIPDAPIVGGQVRGKVSAHVPYLGSVINSVKTWPGLILIIYLPALLVIIDELRRLAAYYRTQMPYIARGYSHPKLEHSFQPTKAATGIFALVLVISFVAAAPVYAQFKTNTVTLANNSIIVATVTPPNTCTGTGNNTSTTVNVNGGGSSNNNVNISNSNNQTATTGNATNSNNTNGGSATSGNATNCNSTNINISIHN